MSSSSKAKAPGTFCLGAFKFYYLIIYLFNFDSNLVAARKGCMADVNHQEEVFISTGPRSNCIAFFTGRQPDGVTRNHHHRIQYVLRCLYLITTNLCITNFPLLLLKEIK